MKIVKRVHSQIADEHKDGSINLLTLSLPAEGVRIVAELSCIIWLAHFISHWTDLKSTLYRSWLPIVVNIALLFVLYIRCTGSEEVRNCNFGAEGVPTNTGRRTKIVLVLWATCMFVLLQNHRISSWLNSSVLASSLFVAAAVGLLFLSKIAFRL